MKWQQMVANSYQNMLSEIEKVLDGLKVEDLHKRPAPGANPIGWLCWHTIRSCDRLLGDVVLGQQLWISAGWHKKFGRPPDINDTGFGHTQAQVDALKIPDIKTLLDYGHAVAEPLMKYIEGLTEQELDRKIPDSQHPENSLPVHVRLARVLSNLQHVGQAGYVRGMIKGHGWYGK